MGDLDTIKALTLASWDPENNEPPLLVAVKDLNTTPFLLAYFRGHHDVAKAILEIAQAQYMFEEEPTRLYRMQEDDIVEAEDNGSNPDIYGEIVDQPSTIENVGQVSMRVKSHVRPLEMLRWESSLIEIKDGKVMGFLESRNSLLGHAIVNNDRRGLKHYHDLAVQFAAQDKEADDGIRSNIFSQEDFWLAVQHGRLEMLADMIRWTGAGLPLEELVEKTNFELEETTRSYQGLTVYGNKRYDSRCSECPRLTDKKNTGRIGRRQADNSSLAPGTSKCHHFGMLPWQAPLSQLSGS